MATSVTAPIARGGAGTDEHNDTGLSVELLANPLLDCFVTALRDGLQVIVGAGPVPVDDPHVSHLRGAPVVRPVMDAVEASASHWSFTIVLFWPFAHLR